MHVLPCLVKVICKKIVGLYPTFPDYPEFVFAVDTKFKRASLQDIVQVILHIVCVYLFLVKTIALHL